VLYECVEIVRPTAVTIVGLFGQLLEPAPIVAGIVVLLSFTALVFFF